MSKFKHLLIKKTKVGMNIILRKIEYLIPSPRSKKLSLNLSLRPQNLNNDTYYKICEIYEEIN